MASNYDPVLINSILSYLKKIPPIPTNVFKCHQTSIFNL